MRTWGTLVNRRMYIQQYLSCVCAAARPWANCLIYFILFEFYTCDYQQDFTEGAN